VAAVGEDAERQRMILGDDALAIERGGEGDLEALDQSAQLVAGAAADGAEADEGDDGLALRENLRDGPRRGSKPWRGREEWAAR